MRKRRGPGATISVPAPDGTLDSLDITDLGERPIADRLDVPPASIPPSPGWLRPSPVLVVIGAIALIAMAINGPDAPGGVTASGDPGTAGSGAPTATADPCPSEGLPDPTVTLVRRGWSSMARDSTPDRWATPAEAGFQPPVDGYADTGAGHYMVLRVEPSACVADLRVDVQATGLAGGDGLGVAIRRTGDGRGWGLFAPPAGDWTVRVAMRLRAGAVSGDDWSIYFLRLRVENAQFAEPVPDGEDPGSGETLVTPARPCRDPDPGDERPPELVLAVGETLISNEAAWSGDPAEIPDLESLPVTELAFGPVPTLTIAGDRCAVNWRIAAGPMPFVGQPFVAEMALDEMQENPSDDPAVAAQNEFRLGYVPLGEFVLMADLEFEGDRRATTYWRLAITGPEMPAGSVRAQTGGEVIEPVIGCGAWLEASSAVGGAVLYDAIGLTATTPCWGIAGESWPAVPAGSIVRLTVGELLRVEVPGHLIADWMLEYDLRIGEPGSNRWLGSGNFETPQGSIGIPAPPPGAWIVRLWLTVQTDSGRIGIPYYFLVDVAT